MQGGTFEKEYLRVADGRIKQLAKKWLFFPKRASPELVYLPPSQGGGGLIPLSDAYDIYYIPSLMPIGCYTAVIQDCQI